MTPEELAEYKLGTPIPLTNLMIKWPCCVILTGFGIMFVISMITVYYEWLLP